MEFALFFTRNDQTVENCLELFSEFQGIGLKHFGFKDVGVERQKLQALADAIHAAGGTSYMEVVSGSPEACIRSVEIAAELGVKRLLGGTQIDEIQEILRGTSTSFFPAAGRPVGHPVRLEGGIAEIVDDCKRFMDKGCAGVDLLAFRSA